MTPAPRARRSAVTNTFMNPNPKLQTLAKSAAALPDLLGSIEARRQAINRAMEKLKRAGLTYATEHWRDGQYLYLLHPSKAGEKRRREYVGADPLRIGAARAAIRRAQEFDALALELKQLDRAALDADRHLRALISVLRGV